MIDTRIAATENVPCLQFDSLSIMTRQYADHFTSVMQSDPENHELGTIIIPTLHVRKRRQREIK